MHHHSSRSLQTALRRSSRFVLLALLIWSSTSVSGAQTTDAYVTQGRVYLAVRRLADAQAKFESAVAIAPNHATANVFCAATRLLTIADKPAGKALLDRLGFSADGRSIYDWTSEIAVGTNGLPYATPGMSAAEISWFLRTNVLFEVTAASAHLQKVTQQGFTLPLSSGETRGGAVTLDYGDVLMLRAVLKGAEYLIYTIYSWNLDAQFTTLRNLAENGLLSAETVLREHPSLFTFATTADLAAARTALTEAVDLYSDASEFIRNRPTNVIRLFNLDWGMVQPESEFRTTLDEIRRSLNGPVVLTFETNLTVHAARLFSGTDAPRSFLPSFAENRVIAGTLPDPSFGAVLNGAQGHELESVAASELGVSFVPRLQVPMRLADGSLTISVRSLDAHIVTIEVSQDLTNWFSAGWDIVENGVVSFHDSPITENAARYYQVVDIDGSVTFHGTVKDVLTSQPITNAQVSMVLQHNNSVFAQGFTDNSGRFLLVPDIGDTYGGYFQITVSAAGYQQVNFEEYLGYYELHGQQDLFLAPNGFSPTNDDFADRTRINGAPFSVIGFNVGATAEAMDPYIQQPGNRWSVWWEWTAPRNGVVSVDTWGSSFQNRLSVYSGQPMSLIGSVESYEDYDEPWPVDFFVQEGKAYVFAVQSNIEGPPGMVKLNLKYVPARAPAFDLFDEYDDPQIVYSGGNISMWPYVEGALPITFQWYRDGFVLPSQTNFSLRIAQARPSDSGAYTLVAHNAAGTSTSPAVNVVVITATNDFFSSAPVITGISTSPPATSRQPQKQGNRIMLAWMRAVRFGGSGLRQMMGLYT